MVQRRNRDVIECYDRVRTGGAIRRIHQEDICQALGLPPTQKYQSDGGPGVRAIAELLTNGSTAPNDDVRTFVAAVAFNWFIAGPDAHAKNYALLSGAQSRVRLAPLYDHPSGKFAYVANELSNNVSAYTIDSTTGALNPVTGSALRGGVVSRRGGYSRC